MGGVSALLMVTMLGGVTYGWQPDGNEGVEYIIQVPPEQVADMQREGAISSVIDPAVRGQVTKVTVRIGNGALPRELPRNFTVASNEFESGIAKADLEPMPIPQSQGRRSRETVMKPQNGGMTLPGSLSNFGQGAAANPAAPGANASSSALQSATNGLQSAGADFSASMQSEIDAARKRLGDAANNALTDAVDRTGQTIQGAVNSALGNPNLGNPNTPSAPGSTNQGGSLRFTGGDLNSGRASSRPGGPTTEPVSPSARSPWPTASTGAGPATTAASQQGRVGLGPPAMTLRGGPTTDPLAAGATNPFRNQSQATNQGTTAASQGAGSQRPGTQGPTSLQPYNPFAAKSAQPQSNQTVGNSLQPKSAYSTPGTTATVGNRSGITSSDNFGRLPAGLSLDGNTAPNSRTPMTHQDTYAKSGLAGAPASPYAGRDQGSASRDGATIAGNGYPPGTFSVDAQGRPVNAKGELIDEYGQPIPSYRRNPATAPAPIASNPPASQPLRSARLDTSYSGNVSAPSTTPRQTMPPQGYAGGPRDLTDSRRYPPTQPAAQPRTLPPQAKLVDHTSSSPQSTAKDPPHRMFTLFLLLSMVGNIYLAAWMHKVQRKYRELIATTRAAANAASS